MKPLAILSSIILLLVALPWLHGFLVSVIFESLASHPTAMSFFYLFTIPAWSVAIMVFVVESYRRGFIPTHSRINNTLLLGLLGMLAPAAGLALSPVASEVSLAAYTGIAALGFFLGLLGARLYSAIISRVTK